MAGSLFVNMNLQLTEARFSKRTGWQHPGADCGVSDEDVLYVRPVPDRYQPRMEREEPNLSDHRLSPVAESDSRQVISGFSRGDLR